MPDLQSLLARAAELAPEWCEHRIDDGYESFVLPGDQSIYDPFYDEDKAIILYAVLKECERRGWSVGVGFSPGNNLWSASVNGEQATFTEDPTHAALSAFVAMLEQAKEVTT